MKNSVLPISVDDQHSPTNAAQMNKMRPVVAIGGQNVPTADGSMMRNDVSAINVAVRITNLCQPTRKTIILKNCFLFFWNFGRNDCLNGNHLSYNTELRPEF